MKPPLLSRIFAEAKKEGRIALLGYLPAGYPDKEAFLEAALTAFAAGIDILEFGLPSPDPYLDGETIRRAVASARAGGTGLAQALDLAPLLCRDGRALVAMMYASSYAELGAEASPALLAGLGFSGLLVVGGQAGDWKPLARASREAGIEPIAFAADPASLEAQAGEAGGFVYLPSYQGKTGLKASFGAEVGDRITRTRLAAGGLPVAVGFGVNSPADVSALRDLGADGAIVGTALVEAASDPARLKAYVEALRDAARGGRP